VVAVVATVTPITSTIVEEIAGVTKKMLETGVKETSLPTIKDLKLPVLLTRLIEVACAVEAPVVDAVAWTNRTEVVIKATNLLVTK